MKIFSNLTLAGRYMDKKKALKSIEEEYGKDSHHFDLTEALYKKFPRVEADIITSIYFGRQLDVENALEFFQSQPRDMSDKHLSKAVNAICGGANPEDWELKYDEDDEDLH
jgi:UTP-glucose-1-phosphate uridylyltransferase